MRYSIWTAIPAFLFSVVAVFAQSVGVQASLDSTEALIGQQRRLSVSFKSNEKVSVSWPDIKSALGKLEIIDTTKVDTVKKQNDFELIQKFHITSFDTGIYEIPAISFAYNKAGNSEPYAVSTDHLILKFATVAVDTAEPIKDIKAPLGVGFSILDYWVYILVYFILGVILPGIYFWRKRSRKAPVETKIDFKIPPHEYALNELQKLDNEKLWQSGNYKLYHSRLTDIIRIYIQRMYEIPAMEMISSDIIESLSILDIKKECVEHLKVIFSTADLAKFAKYAPIAQENVTAIKFAYDFVELTRKDIRPGYIEQPGNGEGE